jgi:hypothetical protein
MQLAHEISGAEPVTADRRNGKGMGEKKDPSTCQERTSW